MNNTPHKILIVGLTEIVIRDMKKKIVDIQIEGTIVVIFQEVATVEKSTKIVEINTKNEMMLN